MEEMNNKQRLTAREVLISKRLNSAGWGLFFVWTGAALVSQISWGAGLLGVGIITLGEQAVRKYFEIQAEVFWILIGFLLFIGGIWELAKIQFGLLPLLSIAMGVALLVSAFTPKQATCTEMKLPGACFTLKGALQSI